MSEPGKLQRPPTSATRHGNGAGHGGAANGAVYGSKGFVLNDTPRQDWNKGTNVQGHNQHTSAALTRAERRRERADRMEDILSDIAEGSERDSDRVAAARALHAICDGMPTQRQDVRVNMKPREMSDEELDAIIEADQTEV